MGFKDFITKTTEKARSGADKVSLTIKLYAKKNALSDKLNGLYDTMGKICYFKAINGGDIAVDSDIDVIVHDITDAKNELEAVEEEIRERLGRILCNKCGMELQKDVSYCPYCGERVNNADSGSNVVSPLGSNESTKD